MLCPSLNLIRFIRPLPSQARTHLSMEDVKRLKPEAIAAILHCADTNLVIANGGSGFGYAEVRHPIPELLQSLTGTGDIVRLMSDVGFSHR